MNRVLTEEPSPRVAFLAAVLLGINEVAIQIEEPFTMLPLEVSPPHVLDYS